MLLFALAVLASACGSDGEPELTLEERLEAIEGRALTAVEVADKLSVAEALCVMDEAVLDAVWRQLTDDQLAFQDFAFGQICPDRSVFYAGLTGRYVTEEAESSGVVTSTTKPPLESTTSEVETPTTVVGPGPASSSLTPDPEVTPTTSSSGGSGAEGSTQTTESSSETTPPEGEGG